MEDLLALVLSRFLTTSIQLSLVIQNQVSKVEFMHSIPEPAIVPLAVTPGGRTQLVTRVQVVVLAALTQPSNLGALDTRYLALSLTV